MTYLSDLLNSANIEMVIIMSLCTVGSNMAANELFVGMYRISGSSSGLQDIWPFFQIMSWVRIRPKWHQLLDISPDSAPSILDVS